MVINWPWVQYLTTCEEALSPEVIFSGSLDKKQILISADRRK
jgi:hypothetical protein